MEALRGLIQWLGDPAHWQGTSGVPSRVLEHVEISLLSVGVAMLIALPVGLLVGHLGRAEFVVASVANIGRALPSFGIVALALPITISLGLGLGFWPTVIALVLLGIPPVLVNAAVGVGAVEGDVVEAARGMGMSGRGILLRIELPLAAPVIVAGVRTAIVQVIATATLGALVGWGGLGRFIIDGFAVSDTSRILAGAVLVAVLAIAAEVVFAGLERLVTPRMDSAGGRERIAEPVSATGG